MYIPPSGRQRRNSPLWLIIFSDMSTNLMMFFLMLFAMTRMSASEKEMLIEGMEKAMDSKPHLEKKIQEQEQEASAIQGLMDALDYGMLREYTNVELFDDKLKLTLEIPFFFTSGSADLTSEAASALKGLVLPLQNFENDIIIEGHTDNVPISSGRFYSNWELSVARAVSVLNYFTSKDVPQSRMIAAGYGEYHPISPNDTDENRALNRRIEISILRGNQ
jgi:chemotaxis protein MotB